MDPDDSKTQRDVIFAIILLLGGPPPKHTSQESSAVVPQQFSLLVVKAWREWSLQAALSLFQFETLRADELT